MPIALSLLLACSAEPPAPEPPPATAPQAAAPDPAPAAEVELADLVATLDDPGRDTWQHPAEVIALLDVTEGQSLVDLGAGTGYFLPYLARATGPRGRVLALEPEERLVDHMASRIEAEGLLNVSARRIPFDDPLLDAAVDRVLVVNAWRYIDDRAEYAAKLAAGLTPDGAVLVVDFDPGSAEAGADFPLTAEQTVSELAGAGLDARVLEESLPKQFAVLARRHAAG
jgi:predicted methyltransferase